MQVEIQNLTLFDTNHIGYFDLHDEFGLASLVERDENVWLELNGTVIRSWPKGEQPEIWWLKWFDASHVIFKLHGPQIAIVSAQSFEPHELGFVGQLYLSSHFMIATYGEEQFYGSRPGDLESQAISVFSHNGRFEFGVRSLMDKDPESWEIDEVEAGYVFEGKFVFIAYRSELLWILNIEEKSWSKFPTQHSLWGVHLLSGDDEKAYGILDNRWDKERTGPPLELVTIDLLAGKDSMHDFMPVENILIAAGFAMREIKFQPNSTGRIIVSDSKQAGLLEFSDLA